MAYGTINADVVQSSVPGVSLGAGNATVFKNRIINGDMRIDQRNAGASITNLGAGAFNYVVDRWAYYATQASKFTIQQNAGSVTPPVGFTNYLGVTSSSAYSSLAADIFLIDQPIEGFNAADLQWGTANAKTVTLSFWVRSSLTGTFGGSFMNSAQNRAYPFAYTISSANTWTQISITVAGDTSGTWLTTNGIGIYVFFNLGSGTTYSGTAGTWAGTPYYSATGATNVVATSGATFYITGVQLEVGSSATGFEYVNYTTQLAMCQRYYQKSFDIGTAPVQNSGTYSGAIQYVVVVTGSVYYGQTVAFPVLMRTSPTITYYSPGAATTNWWNRSLNTASGPSSTLFSTTSPNSFTAVNNPQVVGDTASHTISVHYAVTAEL
jgi:hypothetical protein